MTADKRWSAWPIEPSYVLAMREAVKSVARTSANVRSVPAGGILRYLLSENHQVRNAEIEVPFVEKPKPLTVEIDSTSSDVEPSGNAESEKHFLTYQDTKRAGLYRMTWRDPRSTNQEELFAVNPDARESRLDRVEEGELQQLWVPLQVEVISALGDDNMLVAVRGEEIWRTLAVTLLSLFVLEACFATWTGRGR